jgi:hypothetical protein
MVLDWMIGFTGPSLQVHLMLVTINTTCTYKQHSTITALHTFHFTAAHALGFLVSTSHCLVADLNTGTSTSNHYEVFLLFLFQSPWNADPILQFKFSGLCTAWY